jgi:CDP-diacylglycerol--glycerol-3-phosphate 3-phosphatidyltransferase
MIPIFLAVLYIGFRGCYIVAAVIFVAASVTDYADGYIARSRGQVTNFGKFMDPLADKVLVFAAMLWFTSVGIMPAWAVLLVILREFAVTALRLIAVDNGRVIAAAITGKIKTASTMVCLTAMFFSLPTWLNWVLTGIIVVVTLVSGVEYFVKNRDIITIDK